MSPHPTQQSCIAALLKQTRCCCPLSLETLHEGRESPVPCALPTCWACLREGQVLLYWSISLPHSLMLLNLLTSSLSSVTKQRSCSTWAHLPQLCSPLPYSIGVKAGCILQRLPTGSLSAQLHHLWFGSTLQTPRLSAGRTPQSLLELAELLFLRTLPCKLPCPAVFAALMLHSGAQAAVYRRGHRCDRPSPSFASNSRESWRLLALPWRSPASGKPCRRPKVAAFAAAFAADSDQLRRGSARRLTAGAAYRLFTSRAVAPATPRSRQRLSRVLPGPRAAVAAACRGRAWRCAKPPLVQALVQALVPLIRISSAAAPPLYYGFLQSKFKRPDREFHSFIHLMTA